MVETTVAETPIAETPVVDTPVAEVPVEEAPVVETPVAEIPVAEAPVVETPVTEAPAVDTAPVTADNTNDQVNWETQQSAAYYPFAEVTEPVAPKKKKKWWKVAVFTLVPLALVAAIVAMNFTLVAGYAIKWFGSDSAYLKFVEANSIAGYADDITDLYDALRREGDSKYVDVSSVQTEMKILISDELKGLLSQAGADVDLSWLNNTKFKVNADINDNLISMFSAVEIDGQQILSMDYIMDYVNMQVYMRIKELSEKYIGVDGSKVPSAHSSSVESLVPTASVNADNLPSSIKMLQSLKDVLPNGDVLDDIIKRYVETALGALDSAEATTKTVKLNSVEQDLTCIQMNVTTGMVMDVAMAVIDELGNDDDIKDIINDLPKELTSLVIPQAEGNQSPYAQFCMALEQAKKSIVSERKLMTPEVANEVVFSIKDYVNSKHEVVGRTISIGENEIFTYITVTDGDNFAFEAEAENVAFSGEGTNKSGIINATYTVNAKGTEVVQIKLLDFDENEFDDGNLVGKVRIIPSQAVLSQLAGGQSAGSVLGMLNFAFECSFDLDEDGGSESISILNGDKVFFGIEATISMSDDAADITVPSGDNVIMIDDESDMQEWAKDFDIQKIIDNLKKTNIPDEYVEMLEDLVNGSNSKEGYTDIIGDIDGAY